MLVFVILFVTERYVWFKKHRRCSVFDCWSLFSSTRIGYFEAFRLRFRIYFGTSACTYVALYHVAFSVHFKVLRVSSILPFYIRQIVLRCSYDCVVMCFVFPDKFKPINRLSQNLMWILWFRSLFLHFSSSAINNISISMQTFGMGATLVVFSVESLNMCGNRCSNLYSFC